MKKKLVALFGAAALVAAVSAGSASSDPGNGNNCVGAAVSDAAHFTQQTAGEGFGDFIHDAGGNPGKLIQAFHATCP